MNEQNNNSAMKFIGPNQGGENNSSVIQPQTLSSVLGNTSNEVAGAQASIQTPEPIPSQVNQPVSSATSTLGTVIANNSETPSESVAPVTNQPLTLGAVLTNNTPAASQPEANLNQQPAIQPQTAPIAESPVSEVPVTEQVNNGNSLPSDEGKPKKKMSPIVIVALVLIVLVVGGGLLYYFVLSTPKKIFTTAFNSLSKQINMTAPSNMKYTTANIGANISTKNEKYKQYSEIINKLKINATYGSNDNKFLLNGMVTYSDKELLNLNLLVDQDIVYVKANSLLDKVLKINLNNESDEKKYKPDFDLNDYEQIEKSILNALESALDKGNYKKELVSLDGSRVVKSTLKIDGVFLENIHTKLSNDDTFLNSLATISDKTVNEIVEEMNKELNEYKNNDEEIAIYTTLLKNEVIKLVFTSDKDEFTLTPNGNNYNYEVKENNKTTYKGYIRYNNVGTNSTLVLNVEIPNESTKILLNMNTLVTDSLEELDTTSAIDIDKLNEDDSNELIGNLFKNEAVKDLLTDLDMKETDVAAFIA